MAVNLPPPPTGPSEEGVRRCENYRSISLILIHPLPAAPIAAPPGRCWLCGLAGITIISVGLPSSNLNWITRDGRHRAPPLRVPPLTKEPDRTMSAEREQGADCLAALQNLNVSGSEAAGSPPAGAANACVWSSRLNPSCGLTKAAETQA